MNERHDVAVPNRFTHISAWFQELRRETLSGISQDIQHKNRVFASQLEARRQQAEKSRQLLKECGLGLKRLDELEEEEGRKRESSRGAGGVCFQGVTKASSEPSRPVSFELAGRSLFQRSVTSAA